MIQCCKQDVDFNGSCNIHIAPGVNKEYIRPYCGHKFFIKMLNKNSFGQQLISINCLCCSGDGQVKITGVLDTVIDLFRNTRDQKMLIYLREIKRLLNNNNKEQ